MSSTSTTEFYGLTQYVGTDKPSFTDNNEAFRQIDADLHEAVTGVASQGEAIATLGETVTGLGGDVTNLSNDLNTEKGKIVAIQEKNTQQDAAIADVKADALDMICANDEEAATSTHAYAIGEYFRYNDVLYTATSAIAIGDTIVPNVNCKATNITEELLNIDIDTSSLQPKEDNTLDTTSKEIVGAINEVNSDLGDIETEVAYLKRNNLGAVSPLTGYTSPSVQYTFPNDGYLMLTSHYSTQALITATLNNSVAISVKADSNGSRNNAIFVKKGMTVFETRDTGAGANDGIFYAPLNA